MHAIVDVQNNPTSVYVMPVYVTSLVNQSALMSVQRYLFLVTLTCFLVRYLND